MAAETALHVDFLLPSLGSDMEEGTVTEWLVAVGDRVDKGDVLLRVDTEKAEIDVEVWHPAVVTELLVGVGETVAVGTPLARLGSGEGIDGETPPEPSGHERPAPSPLIDKPVTPVPTPEPPAATVRAPSAPLVQPSNDDERSAIEAGPRLVYWPAPDSSSAASGSSPQAALSPETGTATEPELRTRAERRQAAVASLMARSNQEIPHFHLVRQIDVTSALGWLETHNDSVPPPQRVLPAALMLAAVARAAAGSPINGTSDLAATDIATVDLGVAVHVRGGGLMTPVLPAVDRMPLDVVMSQLQAMVARTRSGRLNTGDMTQATLTVTNLGDSGADLVVGVIRPPERALVGLGRVTKRAAVVDDVLTVRSMVDVTLSADHRIINGQVGARFLEKLDAVLDNPEALTGAGDNS